MATNTTACVLLDRLERGEASAYELVKSIRGELGHVWPRAESRLYAEAKRLVEAGLAKARAAESGRRRTVLSITDAGREALGRWRAAPVGTTTYESEPMLRLMLARSDGRTEMLRALDAVEARAEELREQVAGEAARHLDSEGATDGLPLRALYLDYLAASARAEAAWASRARREIERWGDGRPGVSATLRARTRLRRLVP